MGGPCGAHAELARGPQGAHLGDTRGTHPGPTMDITRKTKITVVDKNRTDDHKFILNGEELEEVNSFVYLGSLINTEVSCMPEVNRRLCMARNTIENMTTIWKSPAICKSLKLRIARATTSAVATYGCESWAYSKKVTKKIEAFEMWT